MAAMALHLHLLLALSATLGPPPPPDVGEGDFVEIDGVYYQRQGEHLYTLDDEHLEDAQELTVTGSRLDKDRTRQIIRAEVIDEDAIRESGARTLADVLEEQGGIQVNSSLGLGSEVFVDGLDGRHVLILVDGRPVNGKVNNRVDVSRLPISPGAIDRIEIVRGPMSALYGSEALGGVINIITKKPEATTTLDVGGEAEVGGQLLPGGAPWRTLGAHGRLGFGPLALRLDLVHQDMPGFDRGGRESGPTTPDGKGDVPDRRQGSYGVDVVVTPSSAWSVRSALQASTSSSSATVAAGAPFRDVADNAEVAWSTTAAGSAAIGLAAPVEVSADVRIDRFTHRFAKQPRGDAALAPAFCGGLFEAPCPAALQVRTDAIKDEARLELRADSVFVDDPDLATFWGREVSASMGTVLLQERAVRENGDDEDTLPGGGQRTTASLYGEGLWRPTRWLSVLPGARVDMFLVDGDAADGDDAATTSLAFGPKLAGRVELPAGFSARAAVGRGFRLPSFVERFLRFDHSELGYIVEGNPLLLPEQSTGVRGELGFADKALFGVLPVDGGLELGINALENLITEVGGGDAIDGIPVFTYANASRALTAALTTRLKVGRVPVSVAGMHTALSVDATWQFLLTAVDLSACPTTSLLPCSAAEGARSLPLRPTHAVDVTGRVLLLATDTTLFARVDGMTERPLIDAVAPAALILSAGLRQPVALFGGSDGTEGAELVLGLENLLDQTDPVFGPKPGRHISINLRAWR